MADVLFNSLGVPLVGYGSRHFFQTTGFPSSGSSGSLFAAPSVSGSVSGASSLDKPLKVLVPSDPNQDKTSVESFYVADWGTGNRFPDTSDALISRVVVLNTGLNFIRNFTLGQGIYPVRVVGYDDRGNEQLEMVPDQEIRRFVNSRMVRRYPEKALRDYLKFGPAFVQLLPNLEGNRLVGISTVNARYCRLSVANAWVDRQNILDPLEAFLRFNGVPEDIELRFRNTILTTLDSGAGTSRTIS